MLTVEEVSELTGMSVATVRRHAKRGKFSAQKIGRQWLVRRSGVTVSRKSRVSIRAPQIDISNAMQQLRSRDFVEIWVPDILAFEDVIADPTDTLASASDRLAAQGPFDSVVEVEVPKSAFFSRPAAMLSIEDRVAYHAAVALLAPRIESALSENVFSARMSSDPRYLLLNGRNQWLRWKAAVKDAIAAGFAWVVKTDVTSYFDNIEHRLLFSDIDALNPDPGIAASLKRMLGRWASVPGRGIPQGPDVSRVLGNLYLVPVDEAMAAGTWRYLRYMDDIRVLGTTRAEVVMGVQALERECRRRGLVLSAHKTELLVGQAAVADETDSEMTTAQYWVDIGHDAEARRQLRRILRSALKQVGIADGRRARFSLWRLRGLRDHVEIRTVLDNLERLAPVASIAVQYLRPFLERKRVLDGLIRFLADPERNTSSFVSTWVLALLLEAPRVPSEVLAYARRVTHNRNQPTYHRVVAANTLARGRRPMDLQWLADAVRSEFDPALVRGYVVALARVDSLSKDAEKSAVGRSADLAKTVRYVRSRNDLPSLIYKARRVAIVR